MFVARCLLVSFTLGQTWTTVTISPPPPTCASSWSSDAVCNPLQSAVHAAAEYTEIHLREGTYFNEGWSGVASPMNLDNGALCTLQGKSHLTIRTAPGASARAKLAFDGAAAISIKDSHYVSIVGLEIEGAAARITGLEASENRRRLAGKDIPSGNITGVCGTNECGSCQDETACVAAQYCKWTASSSRCGAETLTCVLGRVSRASLFSPSRSLFSLFSLAFLSRFSRFSRTPFSSPCPPRTHPLPAHPLPAPQLLWRERDHCMERHCRLLTPHVRCKCSFKVPR